MKGVIYQSGFYSDIEGAKQGVDEAVSFLEALKPGTDIVVLPESADMPFPPATREEYEQAWEMNTPRLLSVCRETAKRLGCVVFVNAGDKTEKGYYNTTFAFDRQGNIVGKYLKQHLTPGEITRLKLRSDYCEEYAEPYTIEIDGVKYAFLTCYDFYFYESLSFIAQKRPHVIIGCAQQRSDTHETAKIYGRFIAYTTGAYLLRSGVSLGDDCATAGSSMAVGPDGEILAYKENGAGAIEFEFDPFKKYLKPMGFMNPVGLHHDYTEKGRRPWKYRAAGSAVIRDDKSLPYPRLCAHRGFSTIAPENSMPAFGAAVALGAQEIEFDLWWTQDGDVVSIHDSTLDRVSDGHGKVYEKTLEELRQLDFGFRFSDKYKGLRIVRFEEILKHFSGQVIMNVHIKDTDDVSPLDEEHLKRVIRLIDKYDNRRYVYFMSGNDAVLRQLKRLAPDIALCVGENSRHFEIVNRAIELGIDRVQLFKPYFNTEMIQKAKQHGIKLNVFWSDEPEEARRFLDMGIDCILTNDYLNIKTALKDRIE